MKMSSFVIVCPSPLLRFGGFVVVFPKEAVAELKVTSSAMSRSIILSLSLLLGLPLPT